MSDETTAPQATTPQTWEEKLAASHPEVVAEFKRLHRWVEVCLGLEVSVLGGKSVD